MLRNINDIVLQALDRYINHSFDTTVRIMSCQDNTLNINYSIQDFCKNKYQEIYTVYLKTLRIQNVEFDLQLKFKGGVGVGVIK